MTACARPGEQTVRIPIGIAMTPAAMPDGPPARKGPLCSVLSPLPALYFYCKDAPRRFLWKEIQKTPRFPLGSTVAAFRVKHAGKREIPNSSSIDTITSAFCHRYDRILNFPTLFPAIIFDSFDKKMKPKRLKFVPWTLAVSYARCAMTPIFCLYIDKL